VCVDVKNPTAPRARFFEADTASCSGRPPTDRLARPAAGPFPAPSLRRLARAPLVGPGCAMIYQRLQPLSRTKMEHHLASRRCHRRRSAVIPAQAGIHNHKGSRTEHALGHGCPPRAQKEAGGCRSALSPIVLDLDPRLRGDDGAEVRHFTRHPRSKTGDPRL